MSVRAGTIDTRISGDLITKFGESLPIPFINNVTVTNDGISVTLSIYYKVTKRQLDNKEFFVDAIRTSGINVYYMLLVEETLDAIANHPQNYNYKKFLNNLEKINKKESHILNYINPYILSSTEAIRGTTSLGFPKPYFGYSSPPNIPKTLAIAYPQREEDISFWRSSTFVPPGSLTVTGVDTTFTSYYGGFESLKPSLHTNTYKVDINNFLMSDVVFSKEEEPIIVMRATDTLKYNAKTSGGAYYNIVAIERKPALTSLLEAASTHPYIESKAIEHETPRDAFFGHNSAISAGIKKCGIVSFSTLFNNLERRYDSRSGVQALFRSEKGESNFYKSHVSDVSHTMIMENGIVLSSPMIIFEDINKNIVESSDAIQSINSQYHAQDAVTSADIIESMSELLSRSQSSEVNTHIDSLSVILDTFGNSIELLPELNKFRSLIPDRSAGTLEGKFYESLKNKIYDANQLVMQGRILKKLINNNPLVVDLRQPMFASEGYKAREDILTKFRQKNHDSSYTRGRLPGITAVDDGTSKDFIPFIYTKGHDYQGQVGLDPDYNPLAVPKSFQMAPYFAADTMGLSPDGASHYSTIRSLINQLYTDFQAFQSIRDSIEATSTLDTLGFEYYLRNYAEGPGGDGTTYSDYEVTVMLDFAKYLLAQFKNNLSLSGTPSTIGDFQLEDDLGFVLDRLTGDTYNVEDFNLASSYIEGNALSNNEFTIVENGHYSFDYEKALGLFSNISMVFNTEKIERFFGRRLLQSKFRVKQTRVDIHAKLISQGTGYNHNQFIDMEQYPRDKSGGYAMHLPIGTIIGYCDMQNDSLCDPAITRCKVEMPTYLYTGLPAYQLALNAYLKSPESGGPALNVDDLYELGTEVDYGVYSHSFKRSIETGYEIGPEGAAGLGTPFQYQSLFDQLYSHSEELIDYGYDEYHAGMVGMTLEAILIDATKLTPYGTSPVDGYDTSASDRPAAERLEAYNARDGMPNRIKNLTTQHSYIALKNIGGVYNTYTGTGPTNFLMKHWTKHAGTPVLQAVDEPMASFLTNPVTDYEGKSIVKQYAAGARTEDEINDLTSYYWINNQFSYMPGVYANMSEDTYRLMTFEFQKVGRVPERLMEFTEIGSSFANILAFRAGIFPSEIAKYINRQFYEFYVQVEDTTRDVYNFLIELLQKAMKMMTEYYNLCLDNCVYNDISQEFNSFFIEGIEAEFGSLSEDETPWIFGPLIYCFHVDLLTNKFNGNKDEIIRQAESITRQIAQSTGTLAAIKNFKETLQSLYSEAYSTEAMSTPGTPAFASKQMGTNIIHFGRPYTGFLTKEGGAAMLENTYMRYTSAYTTMVPFTYNGYSTNFVYDLQDSFKTIVSKASDTITHVGTRAGIGDTADTADMVYDSNAADIRITGDS